MIITKTHLKHLLFTLNNTIENILVLCENIFKKTSKIFRKILYILCKKIYYLLKVKQLCFFMLLVNVGIFLF